MKSYHNQEVLLFKRFEGKKLFQTIWVICVINCSSFFVADDPFTEHCETFRTNMRSSESENFSARERSKQQNSTRNREFDTSRTFGGRKRKPDFGEWSARFNGKCDHEPSWTSAKKPREEHSSTNRNGCSANLPKDPVIERPLEVSLEEIATGCVKKLKIKRSIYDERGYSTQEEHVIEIRVKPGWKAGTKLTYPKLGDKHPGREAADITFILKDKPHALFSRDSDNNLLHTANVSLKKALLGVSYCIQGLNQGQRHDVNVKDIVHPGYTKRYVGEGLPLPKTPSKRGDLIVTFNIEFPTFLSWDQRRVLTDCLPN